jgi:TetR/AcrR family transcriptional regulator
MKKAPVIKRIERNPERTRERILAAALTEFAAKGFAGARVDCIAGRARINKRMLYHYFGEKEVLFREVLRRKIAQRSAWLASAPEDPVESLSLRFQLACRDPEWIRMLEWEALDWGERAVIDEERRKEGFGGAVQRIRRWQAEGLLDDKFDAAQLLLSLLALTAYPMAFPQLARLATGLPVSSSKFQKQRDLFLRQFAGAFRAQSETDAPRNVPISFHNKKASLK